MHIVRWLVGATLFLALVFLSLQNSEPAELKFFNLASFRAPLVVVVFVAFAVGVAIGLLTGALRAARLERQVNRLRREHHARGNRAPWCRVAPCREHRRHRVPATTVSTVRMTVSSLRRH